MSDDRAFVAVTLFVQTSVVLLAALTAARCLRAFGPSVRSAILRAALAAMVACPLISAAIHLARLRGLPVIPRIAAAPAIAIPMSPAKSVSEIPIDRRTSAARPEIPRDPSVATVPHAIAPAPGLPSSAVLPLSSASPADWRLANVVSVNSVVIGLWIAISTLLLARLAIANLLIVLSRRSARPASAAVQERCRSVARELGVIAPPVLMAPGLTGPCLVGWFRPVILLPNDGADVEREILIHELAHLARRDCAWQLLARLAASVIWFQPLVWIWARAIEQSAEEACDDAVIAHNGNRLTYVNRIADLAERAQQRWVSASAGVGVVGMRSIAGRRIGRLLHATHRASNPLDWRSRAGIILVAVLAALGLGVLQPAASQSASADEPKSLVAAANQRTGRVFSAEGRPIGGAHVVAMQSRGVGPVVLATTQSDENGNFTLRFGSPAEAIENIEIQAVAIGRGVGSAYSNSQNGVDVRLHPSTQITLTLLDPGGKPVSGMRVYPVAFVSRMRTTSFGSLPGMPTMFMRMPPVLSNAMASTTAADGTVTLNDLPRGTRFELAFDDERFAYSGVDQRISVSDDDSTSLPVTVRLGAAATISGVARFVNEAKPASGIDVFAEPTHRSRGSGWSRAVTDEHGAFKLDHLPAGEYNVMLFLDEKMQADWAAPGHEFVVLGAGQNLTAVNFSLIKGGIVTGKVTMADSGKPITDTRVAAQGPAYPSSSSPVQGTKVNLEGTYTLRVPPGMQHVYVQGPLPPAYRPDRQEIRDVKVQDGQTVTMDFEVQRRPGEEVSGVVLGLDGKPAAGISVRAQTTGMSFNAFEFAKSDARGRFHFDAVPVGTPVSVRDEDLGTADSVKVEKGNELRLQLIRRFKVTLPGLVTDPDGNPIAGAQIQLTQSMGRFGMGLGDTLVTDAAGRYEIKDLYLDSDYHIIANADGYGQGQSHVSLSATTRDLPTLKLPRADATTGGTVVDTEGKPLSGVTVHLNNGYSPRTVITDSQGRFSFHILPGTRRPLIWVDTKVPGGTETTIEGGAGKDHLKLVLPKIDQ